MACLVAAAAWSFPVSGGAAVQSVLLEAPEVFGKVYQCKPGPWGDLEYYYIYLEMPDRLLDLFTPPEPITKWHFPGGTTAKLRSLLEKAGLPAPFRQYLLDPRNQEIRKDTLTVSPPFPALMAMTGEQRAVIYRELAKSESNKWYADPICISPGDPDSWLARSRLRLELREAIKRMTYMRGEVLCFSDLAAVLGMVNSEKEVREIMKAMSRTSSIVLRLNLQSPLDLDEVVRYWSGDGRNKEVEPILLSAAETNGMERLDCVHLLPSLPRRYLYRYPCGKLSLFEPSPNCYWTSLNFLNATSLNYNDPRRVMAHLNEDYDRVEPPYRFGDVLVLKTPDDVLVHSCVYLADDIVYTKNGEGISIPWLLKKLGDLRRLYSMKLEATSIQAFRQKSRQDAG